MQNTRRFGGFASIDKICIGIALLLIVLVVGGLPSQSMKNEADLSNVKCSPEADWIPVRSIERVAQKRFTQWAENPVIVDAVIQANDRPARTISEIIELDDKWVSGSIDEQFVNELLNNPCAQYLDSLREEDSRAKGMYREIFVVDNQGCIVAASNKTSDYWQGDEDKFVKPFNGGRGAIFVDDADYDESTDMSLIQVSVPIMDPNSGEAIGVLTVGLNIRVLIEEI
ncbi:MAG: cache domain-containing protein [Phycisphaerae bacterium]|jgi:hypothetical protein